MGSNVLTTRCLAYWGSCQGQVDGGLELGMLQGNYKVSAAWGCEVARVAARALGADKKMQGR